MQKFSDLITRAKKTSLTKPFLQRLILDILATLSKGLDFQDTQLTAAQVNALRATNITLVAAPATGFAVVPERVKIFHDHGGTDFIQAAATDALAIKYAASTEIAELGTEAQMTTFLESTGDDSLAVGLGGTTFVPVAATALVLDNNGATEYTTGDGTFSVRVWFRTVPMTAFS